MKKLFILSLVSGLATAGTTITLKEDSSPDIAHRACSVVISNADEFNEENGHDDELKELPANTQKTEQLISQVISEEATMAKEKLKEDLNHTLGNFQQNYYETKKDAHESETAQKAKEVISNLKENAKNAAHATHDKVATVGHAIKQATTDSAHIVKGTAVEVGHTLKDGTIAIKDAVKKASQNS